MLGLYPRWASISDRTEPLDGLLNILRVRCGVVNQERRQCHWDVIPWGWYTLVQGDPLRHYLLSDKSGGRRVAVGCRFVPPLHPVPRLLGKGGGFLGQEFIDVSHVCIHAELMVRIESHFDLKAQYLKRVLYC